MIALNDSSVVCLAIIFAKARAKEGEGFIGTYRPWIQRRRNRYDERRPWKIQPGVVPLPLAKPSGKRAPSGDYRRKNSRSVVSWIGVTLDRLSGARKTSPWRACLEFPAALELGRLRYSVTQGADFPDRIDRASKRFSTIVCHYFLPRNSTGSFR